MVFKEILLILNTKDGVGESQDLQRFRVGRPCRFILDPPIKEVIGFKIEGIASTPKIYNFPGMQLKFHRYNGIGPHGDFTVSLPQSYYPDLETFMAALQLCITAPLGGVGGINTYTLDPQTRFLSINWNDDYDVFWTQGPLPLGPFLGITVDQTGQPVDRTSHGTQAINTINVLGGNNGNTNPAQPTASVRTNMAIVCHQLAPLLADTILVTNQVNQDIIELVKEDDFNLDTVRGRRRLPFFSKQEHHIAMLDFMFCDPITGIPMDLGFRDAIIHLRLYSRC